MKINGIPVIDAAKPIMLVIGAQDVRKGQMKDPGACAAALACMRQLHASAARVHLGRTYVKIGDKWTRFHTSRALRSEIIAFDRGGQFDPGEYLLTPMQPSRRRGKRQGGEFRRRTGKKRTKPHVVHGVRAHGANR